jgi:F0F1-type ATP synthase membrane subunit b/b'
MNLDSMIFFDLVATILILSITLIVVVHNLSHNAKKNTGKTDTESDDDIKKSTDLLSQTRQKAIRLIDDANSQALDIISKANLTTDTASEAFKQEMSDISSSQLKDFKKTTSDFTKAYSQVLQDLKIKNMETFQNISKDIELNTMEEIKNFKNSMERLTTVSQDEVKKKIDSDYEASKKEIEDHKKEELQKIDSGIYELLEKISKLILGKALNLSEQEDLIEKSLEEAKKEGVFK